VSFAPEARDAHAAPAAALPLPAQRPLQPPPPPSPPPTTTTAVSSAATAAFSGLVLERSPVAPAPAAAAASAAESAARPLSRFAQMRRGGGAP
jgi:hypothetical protein